VVDKKITYISMVQNITAIEKTATEGMKEVMSYLRRLA
jgi:hypothetical protein